MSIDFRDVSQNVYKILIIEDNDTDVLLLKEVLGTSYPKSTIVNVDTVHNARQVLQEYSFDLIILDLNLPDSLGPKTIEDIRHITADTPILIFTGMATSLTITECYRLGAQSLIEKSMLTDLKFTEIVAQYLPR